MPCQRLLRPAHQPSASVSRMRTENRPLPESIACRPCPSGSAARCAAAWEQRQPQRPGCAPQGKRIPTRRPLQHHRWRPANDIGAIPAEQSESPSRETPAAPPGAPFHTISPPRFARMTTISA
ncbi:Hypothetical Protein RRSL_02444 [Ralstonia solanacearum UW551]|uniref:Uncharacterized protein n=1 Tax=Ralstonia solanacearum (strain UW551) TaxID=342110 RepID=A0AB33VF29_RALSU|nr:Hypothetical Protein RRSL_02444 [Ralstonia solanacearum UW551]